MANIIKIPSKHIYKKSTSEIENNKIGSAEVSAKDINIITETQNIYTETKDAERISHYEGQNLTLREFVYNLGTFSDNSFAEKTTSKRLTYDAHLPLYLEIEGGNIEAQKVSFFTVGVMIDSYNVTFNDKLDFGEYSDKIWEINFSSNGKRFYGMRIWNGYLFYLSSPLDRTAPFQYESVDDILVLVTYGETWADDSYKTITFVTPTESQYFLPLDFALWLYGDNVRIDYQYWNGFKVEDDVLYLHSDAGWLKEYDLATGECFFLSAIHNTLHFDNAPINDTIISELKKMYGPISSDDAIKTVEGYNAQYLWNGRYNKYTDFDLFIPNIIDGNDIISIFQYPNIKYTYYGKHYVYNAIFDATLKLDIAKLEELIHSKNLYDINTVQIKNLIKEEEYTSSSLSEGKDKFTLDTTMTSFDRTDGTRGGESLQALLTVNNEETAKISRISKGDNNYIYNVKLLTGVISGSGQLFADELMQPLSSTIAAEARLGIPSRLNGTTTIDVYDIEKVEFSFDGNVLVLDIKEKTLTYGTKENNNYSIKNNELIQTTTTYNGENLIEKQAELIISSYEKGKETATLTCGIAKYYDNDNPNNILIDPEGNNDLPMVIPNNSIVMPYIMAVDENGKTVEKPLSTDKYGNPKTFLVIGREYSYDGSTRQILHTIENNVISNIPSYPRLSPPPTISLDGSQLSIIDNSGVAEQYVILVNGIEKETISSPYIDLSTLSLYVGTHKIAVKAKSSGYTDSLKSNEVTYVVENSPFAKISFKIGEENYFAEETMTWYDWCHSGYNTGSWVAKANDIYNDIYRYVSSSKIETVIIMENNVLPTQQIIADYTYAIKEGFVQESNNAEILDYVEKTFATKKELNDAIGNIDFSEIEDRIEDVEKKFSNYDTSTEVDNKIFNAVDGLVTEGEVNDLVNHEVGETIVAQNLVTVERANEIVEEAIAGIGWDVYVTDDELTNTLGSYSTTTQMETVISAKIGEFSVEVNSQFSGLQNQIDGAISTWYFTGEPTLENEPAKDWTTPEEQENHSGDLYYDNKTGYCYRWQKGDDGVFTWLRIADTDIEKALQEAEDARREAKIAQDMEIGGRNLAWFTGAEESPIFHTGVTVNSGGDALSHRWNLTKSEAYGGTGIIDSIFEVGGTYTVSYFFMKTAGTLLGIGGHISNFTQLRVSVDGKETTSDYSGLLSLNDDTNVHYVVVTVKYNGGSAGNFYIQPNRGSATSVTYDLWNIKVEKGVKATDWTPAWEEYYTTSQTQAQIKEYADSVGISVKSEINTTLENDYYTKALTDSQITVAKNKITQSVSETYSTKTELGEEVEKIEGKIVLGIDTDANGKRYSYINSNADYIKFDSGDLEISSSQFTLTKDGNATFAGELKAASGSFEGTVYATDGEFSGTLYSGKGKIGCATITGKTLLANESIGFVESVQTDIGINDTASKITFVSGGIKTLSTTTYITSGQITADKMSEEIMCRFLSTAYKNVDFAYAENFSLERRITTTSGTQTEYDIPFEMKSIVDKSNSSGITVEFTIIRKDTLPDSYSNVIYLLHTNLHFYDYSNAVTKLLADGTFKTSALIADGGKIGGININGLRLTSYNETTNRMAKDVEIELTGNSTWELGEVLGDWVYDTSNTINPQKIAMNLNLTTAESSGVYKIDIMPEMAWYTNEDGTLIDGHPLATWSYALRLTDDLDGRFQSSAINSYGIRCAGSKDENLGIPTFGDYIILFDEYGGTLQGTWSGTSSLATTSWRGAKYDIEDLSDKYSVLFDNLRPVRHKYVDGTSNRYHTGLILDELKTAMDIAGVDSSEFASYCVYDESTGEGGIRYSELIALCINEIQKLKLYTRSLECQLKNININ